MFQALTHALLEWLCSAGVQVDFKLKQVSWESQPLAHRVANVSTAFSKSENICL